MIRSYRQPDREACLAVFDSNVPEFFSELEREDFEDFLDDLPGPYFVLEQDGVTGCGGYALADGERQTDLCWGMIHAVRHGRGLGTRLLRHRVERAIGEPSVECVVLRTSQATTGFFKRFGFELVSVEPDGFGPGLDRFEMRLHRYDFGRFSGAVTATAEQESGEADGGGA